MLKYFAAILFFMGCLPLLGQNITNEPIKIKGEIKDEKQKPVSYAHILEISGNEGWISDYYGNFIADVYPGDTLLISAVSYQHGFIVIPSDFFNDELQVMVTLKADTIQLKELVVHPWPSTYSQLKREFLEVKVEDPAKDINLNMPSMKDIAGLLKTPGIPGQIGLYSGSGPFSLLYDQFSREARNKRNYNIAMKFEKANARYNKIVVSRITGLKDEEIQRFMEFCALQVKFILESTDYELYAAILTCYNEFCSAGLDENPEGN